MEAPQLSSAAQPRQPINGQPETDAASDHSSRLSSSSSSLSDAMAPPPLPRVSTPPNTVPPSASAGAPASAETPDNGLDTRPSRSASTASRTNRLSLTLPIAPPTAFPSRPTPASSTVSSFPATPIDITSGLASPAEPTNLITAIAAQERRVLEIREELIRAESILSELKGQWAHHEAQRKRSEKRRMEALRTLASRPGTAATADSTAAPARADEGPVQRTTERDRRRSLLQSNQQPAGSDPSTPTQSRRRVFQGGHARTLSLLSPTRSSVSDGFNVHDDQPSDSGSVKSPALPSEPGSPLMQNLSRYAPLTAAQLSKRASWAPQSAHQVAGFKQVAGDFKQVAGDLSATLWTFVEDLRQATVGEELVSAGSSGSAMRSIDGNSRGGGAAADGSQNTIRASNVSSGRPHLSRAFTADLHHQHTSIQAPAMVPLRPAASSNGNGTSEASTPSKELASAASANDSKSKATKTTKRFSWTPLSMDAYDDSDWSNWDSPSVKSPRWSGSTVNSESVTSSIPEQADENVTPQKSMPASSSYSPASPSGSKINDLAWPAALNRLTPGNIKRTATDLMKEWEKSLSPPMERSPHNNSAVSDRGY